MKKLFAILSLVLFTAFTSWAQKDKVKANFGIKDATIYLLDGETFTGDLDFPLSLDVTKIKAKGKEKHSWKVEEIDKVVYETTAGTPIEYYVLPLYKDGSEKIRNNKVLVQLVMRGKVNLYMSSYAGGGGFGPGMNYYCKRENEPALTFLHVDTRGIGFGAIFKRYAPVYFADNSAIVGKIKSGQYTGKNFIEMVTEYNAVK